MINKSLEEIKKLISIFNSDLEENRAIMLALLNDRFSQQFIISIEAQMRDALMKLYSRTHEWVYDYNDYPSIQMYKCAQCNIEGCDLSRQINDNPEPMIKELKLCPSFKFKQLIK